MFHKGHLKKDIYGLDLTQLQDTTLNLLPNAIQIFILKNEIAYRRKGRHLWAGLQSLYLEVPSSNDRFNWSTLGDDFSRLFLIKHSC